MIAQMMHGDDRSDAEDRLALTEGSLEVRSLFIGEKIEKMMKVLSLANLIVFVYDGKYKTPIDRILGARLVHMERYSPRNIPFDFMNQQLVFDELTNFVQFMVPIWRALSETTPMRWLLGRRKMKAKSNSDGEDHDEGCCSVCNTEDPIMPHVGKCEHVGCYVCLMNAMMADRSFACPRCDTPLGQLRPLVPDEKGT